MFKIIFFVNEFKECKENKSFWRKMEFSSKKYIFPNIFRLSSEKKKRATIAKR